MTSNYFKPSADAIAGGRVRKIFIRHEPFGAGYNINIEPAWCGVCNFDTGRDTIDRARAYARKISSWLKLQVVDLTGEAA